MWVSLLNEPCVGVERKFTQKKTMKQNKTSEERKQSVLRSETTASIVQTLQKKQPAFMFHWQTARAAEWIWRRGCDGSKGSLCRIQWQLQLKMADYNQLNTPHHWRGVKWPLERVILTETQRVLVSGDYTLMNSDVTVYWNTKHAGNLPQEVKKQERQFCFQRTTTDAYFSSYLAQYEERTRSWTGCNVG